MNSLYEVFIGSVKECRVPSPRNTTSSEMCQYFTSECNGLKYFYLKHYYCLDATNPIGANISLWCFIGLIIGLLFIILGLLASDYLVPNLSALSGTLKMDEKLAGLTLLAFANGSPDILSTYIAMKNNMTTLAVGELLGSANFALTVVIGVLAIYQPFEVNHTTFMRDLALFLILLLISLFILSNGVISIVESFELCLLYIAFICLNLFLPDNTSTQTEPHDEEIEPTAAEMNNSVSTLPINQLSPTYISSLTTNEVLENDNMSTVSNSSSSNRSLNDYYFAHNVDSLEQGRSFKLPLIDSLKLAWIWKKKSLRPPQQENQMLDDMNEDMEHTRAAAISEISPLNSLKPNVGSTELNEHNHLTQNEDNDYQKSLFNTTPASDESKMDPRSGLTKLSTAELGRPYSYTRTLNSPIIRIEDVSEPEDESHASNDEEIPESLKSDLATDTNLLLNSTPRLKRPSSNTKKMDNNKNSLPKLYTRISTSQILEIPSPILRTESSTSSLISHVEYQQNPSLLYKIIPFHLVLGSGSWTEKVLAIILLPFSTVFNLIVPTPLPLELEGNLYLHELDLSSKLFHFQVGVLPWLLLDFDFTVFVLSMSILLPTVSIASKYYLPKYYNMMFPVVSSIIGFLSVLKSIAYSASGIILFMKDLADIYSLSESILGITILSLGNSVGDVVTNLALAGLGRPLIGLHACFGSPLLYILFGIGICSLIIQVSSFSINNGPTKIEFTVDPSLKLTSFSIIFILILYSIIIPLNNWIFKRWVGVLGCLIWFIVTTINLILHRYR